MTISPDFSTPALVLAAPLVAYLVVGEPWLGRRMYADLERRREHDGGALVRYFLVTLGFWGVLAALVAVIVQVSPGASAADLGLTAPDEPGWTVAIGIAFTAVALLAALRMRRMAREGRNVPGQAGFSAMLPRTPVERRLAAAVAGADAVCGEIVYRGLLIAVGVSLGLNLYAAAAAALVIYALAGLYQGIAAVPLFGFFGLLLTFFYLWSGSLLLPIVMHAVLLVRDLVLVPPVRPETASARPESTG